MGRKVPASFLRILPDYFCLLEFECLDLRRNTAAEGCTVHFCPCHYYIELLKVDGTRE